MNALIDWTQIFTTALAGMEMTTKRRQDLMLGMRRGVSSEGSVTSLLIKNSQDGGSLDLLRVRQNHGRQAILFRMIQPINTGGVGYFEVIPQRLANRKVRAVDIYVFANGELMTTTLRHTLLPIVANESRNLFDRLISGERDFVQDFPKIAEMSKLINQGKAREALAIAKELKPETKKEKIVLLQRLRAAQTTGDQEYPAVLEDFRQNYPRDPCLDLLLVDYYILKSDYAHANGCIDRLDKAIGGDPYLNVLRAGLGAVTSDFKAAREFVDRALKEEPGLVPGYFALLDISLQEKTYKEALDLLKTLDQTFKIKFSDLATEPDYAGCVKSPQYQEWLKYLAQKAAKQKASPTKTPADTQKTPPSKTADSAT